MRTIKKISQKVRNKCMKVRFPLKRIFNTRLRSKLDGNEFKKSKRKSAQSRYIKIALFASLTLVGGILIGSYYHAPIRRTISLIGVSLKAKFLKTFEENSDTNLVRETSNSPISKNSPFGFKNGSKMIFVLFIGVGTFLAFKNAQIKPVPVEIERELPIWGDLFDADTPREVRQIAGIFAVFIGTATIIFVPGMDAKIFGNGMFVVGWQLLTN
jgi:hypothetical protein